MDTMQFILEKFDIKRLRKTCNARRCKKAPTKELLLLEFNMSRPARRIASLYLCENHCKKEAESLPQNFKAGTGKHIGGRIYNINLVTH